MQKTQTTIKNPWGACVEDIEVKIDCGGMIHGDEDTRVRAMAKKTGSQLNHEIDEVLNGKPLMQAAKNL